MCIFYQDELACCCLNGFTWDFSKHVKCVEDYEETCPDIITVTDAKNMKQKLDAIRELVRLSKPDALERILEVLGE